MSDDYKNNLDLDMNIPNKRFLYLVIAVLVLTASLFFFISSVKQLITSLLPPRAPLAVVIELSPSLHGVPFVEEKPIVVLTTRQVCSLYGQYQQDAAIMGQDGGDSYLHNGVSYWTFGDSPLDQNSDGIMDGWRTNGLATTTDFEASDCIDLITNTDTDGIAKALIPRLLALNEKAVWLSPAMINTTPNTISLFYSSRRDCTPEEVSSNDCPLFSKEQGIGLAQFDTSTLEGKRITNNGTIVEDPLIECDPITNCLIFTKDDWDAWGFKAGITFIVPTEVEEEVYIFLATGADLRIGKTSLSSLWDKSAYLYWNGSSWISDITQAVTLWQQPIGFGGFPVTFNDLMIFYNDYLQKWMTVYSTGYMSLVAARVADELTGPWSEEQTLVPCDQFVSPDPSGFNFLCYTGRAHPEFEKNNGQTMYISYANSGEGKLFLQEAVLGTPIYQWEDASGNTVYKQKGVNAPPGFNQKGIAFYASKYPGDNLETIYEWYDSSSSQYIYSASSPGPGFLNQGATFYAPTVGVAGLAPIHRWDKLATSTGVYSALDFSSRGYSNYKYGIAFYAKITNYRVEIPEQVFPTASNDWYEMRLVKDGDFIPATLTAASFSGLTAGEEYNIIICNVFGVGCDALDPLNPNIIANESGEINGTGNYEGASKILVAQPPLIPQSSSITGLEIEGLTPNTTYDFWMCAPNCSEDVDPIIYEVASDVDGKLSWGLFANQSPTLQILDPDVDDNGQVDLFVDIFSVANTFGSNCGDPGFDPTYDMDGNCTIDLFIDIFLVSNAFGTQCWPIPEPNLTCPAGSPLHVEEDQLLWFYVNGADPDEDPLTYSADGLPDGACFNRINSDGAPGTCQAREFRWTPASIQSGGYTVNFTVSDGPATDNKSLLISALIQPPAGPSDLLGISFFPETITIVWTDNSDNEDGFRIRRYESLFDTQLMDIRIDTPNLAGYEDTGLSPGVRYTYEVWSYVDGLDSIISAGPIDVVAQ